MTKKTNVAPVGTVWQEQYLPKIKKLFCPSDITDLEFHQFLSLGKFMDANPFSGEIWCVKFPGSPAKSILGRNFFLKKAQEDPNYSHHISACVYEGDDFNYKIDETGAVKLEHVPVRKADRGDVESGYCLVFRKDTKNPFFVIVDIDEANKDVKGNLKGANWKTMPATMIAKVAEQRCLKKAFYAKFKGALGEDELVTMEVALSEKNNGHGSRYPQEPPPLNEAAVEIVKESVSGKSNGGLFPK